MINARSLATLGIGFGVVAIATLGIVSETSQPVEQPAAIRSGVAASSKKPLPEEFYQLHRLVVASAGTSIAHATPAIVMMVSVGSAGLSVCHQCSVSVLDQRNKLDEADLIILMSAL